MKKSKPTREGRLSEVVLALRTAGTTAVTVVKTVPMGAEIEPESWTCHGRCRWGTSRRC